MEKGMSIFPHKTGPWITADVRVSINGMEF